MNKKLLFVLDYILPALPALTFFGIGMAFLEAGVSLPLASIVFIVPFLFLGVWAVWTYKVRPTLNIPDEGSKFMNWFAKISKKSII